MKNTKKPVPKSDIRYIQGIAEYQGKSIYSAKSGRNAFLYHCISFYKNQINSSKNIQVDLRQIHQTCHVRHQEKFMVKPERQIGEIVVVCDQLGCFEKQVPGFGGQRAHILIGFAKLAPSICMNLIVFIAFQHNL